MRPTKHEIPLVHADILDVAKTTLTGQYIVITEKNHELKFSVGIACDLPCCYRFSHFSDGDLAENVLYKLAQENMVDFTADDIDKYLSYYRKET